MKKKILTILLCGIMVLGLTGCDKSVTNSENNTDNTSNVENNENNSNDKENIKDDNLYDVKVVYFNPVENKTCTNYEKENSKPGTKIGCMKWYVYKEDDNSYTMILDHNSTPQDYYNYNDVNTSMGKRSAKELGKDYNEVGYDLEELTRTSGWKVTPRLISVQEIVDIVGDKTWKAENEKGTILDKENCSKTCKQGENQYGWLFDYTSYCYSFGCRYANQDYIHERDFMAGYWTSTANPANSKVVWYVDYFGMLHSSYSAMSPNLGLRPVITVRK